VRAAVGPQGQEDTADRDTVNVPRADLERLLALCDLQDRAHAAEFHVAEVEP
jgi:hypothetical protein